MTFLLLKFVLRLHLQYLQSHISFSGSLHLTLVHAKSKRLDRDEIWEGLRNFSHNMGSGFPWLICGDFNSFISDVSLLDIQRVEGTYTWTRVHSSSRVWN